MYNRILVPIDLSHAERGKDSIKIAEQLLDPGGTIIALNVVEDVPAYVAAELPGDMLGELQKNAALALQEAVAGSTRTIEREVRRGSPAGVIVATAEELGVNLVIIASHRPGLADYFLGSTASSVVRHAKCPVLVDR
uniref:universal stress protein n=1 Tax=Pararhizobium sp. IMCC3301 TaxID=3067904 RepID=UPI002740B5F8|nr:universal stress protein [Pararhizobium sp. IMCC3301]